MRILAAVLVLLAAAAGIVFLVAGRAEQPVISIEQPLKVVGFDGNLEVTASAPGGRFDLLEVSVEQEGQRTTLFSLAAPGQAEVRQDSEDRLRVRRPFGKRSVPELEAGRARIDVTAVRSVLFGLRQVSASASREVEVRLTPPRISVLSTHHYINHAGSEMVVYTVSPPEAESGVRVGDVVYPGYPGSGAGLAGGAGLRVAFFALLHDQDLDTPVHVFAQDDAGNESRASFDYRVFPKRFRQGRIELDDKFLSKVVPAILEQAPEITPSGDMLKDFLEINGKLRQLNADKIASLAKESRPEMLWRDAFRPLTNASIESGFADRRAYYYGGREVDRQVHLGFDLAVTVNIPVLAANAGKVVFAGYLGIYGNTVIVDHGMGVQSLYAHLASIDVAAGDDVAKEQQLGRSGMTGLAGGDHLHFAMLVAGHPVNPVEWWDPHWIEDRVLRKLREAGAH
ncbi:MAG: M23 family metallopeptidase [Vicinamibacterales bacterium]